MERSECSVGEGNERDIMVVRKERRGVGVRRCTRRRSSEGVQSRTPSQPLQVEVAHRVLLDDGGGRHAEGYTRRSGTEEAGEEKEREVGEGYHGERLMGGCVAVRSGYPKADDEEWGRELPICFDQLLGYPSNPDPYDRCRMSVTAKGPSRP